VEAETEDVVVVPAKVELAAGAVVETTVVEVAAVLVAEEEPAAEALVEAVLVEVAAVVVFETVVEAAVVVVVDPTLVAVEVHSSELWDLGTFRSLGSRKLVSIHHSSLKFSPRIDWIGMGAVNCSLKLARGPSSSTEPGP
jgi:hypothetical protein